MLLLHTTEKAVTWRDSMGEVLARMVFKAMLAIGFLMMWGTCSMMFDDAR